MRRIAVVAVVLASALPATALAHQSSSRGTINLVAYSTPGPVYGDTSTKGTLEYAFAHTGQGNGVGFANSFGPSDSQATAVASGQPADVVNFSYEPNMAVLQSAGDVSSSWDNGTYHGFVADSGVAFAVRPGNPKHIKNWSDLSRSGVRVVTPSTSTSGGARWNILAAYGSQIVAGRSKKKAKSFLQKLKDNIDDEPTSASKAMTAFLAGEGDVLIGYEEDILSAIKAGGKIDLVVPSTSLLIQTPLAYTMGSASSDPSDAKHFVKFLYTQKAQIIWAKNFYWPVLPKIAKRYRKLAPLPSHTLFTIHKLGGWSKVDTSFFSSSGIWTNIDNGG